MSLPDNQRQLYDRNQRPVPLRRSRLPWNHEDTKQAWGGAIRRTGRWFALPILKKLLIAAVIFFVLAAGLAWFSFYRGGRVISSGNVELGVTGPTTASAGAPIALQLSLTNHNSSALQSVTLSIEYPPGTQTADLAPAPLARERLSLGTIAPGATVNRQVRATLFGQTGDELKLGLTAEYRLTDSNAIFAKQTSYSVAINSSPLSLEASVPSEVLAGQDFTLALGVTANAAALPGLALTIEYPPGFVFGSAAPAPSRGNNLWLLPALGAGGQTKVAVKGRLTGQNEDQQAFKISAGPTDPAHPNTLTLIYGSALPVVTIKRPYISLTTAINGDGNNQDYVGGSSDTFHTEINWANNLPEKLYDGEITVTLDGLALDRSTVNVNGGFYQSSGNTIVWNKNSQNSLGTLEAGASGNVSFQFGAAAQGGTASRLTNPMINLGVQFKARRAAPSGNIEPILVESHRAVKLDSLVQLAQKALYHSGPLTNTGPLPPVADRETTYTVVWSVLNANNDLGGVRVRATLPPAVRFTNSQTPASEQLNFTADPSGGGELVWEIGALRAGTGFGQAAREVSFQIGLTPSLSQVGETPELLGAATLTGVDSFTQDQVGLTGKRPLDTYITADPQFKNGDEKVQSK